MNSGYCPVASSPFCIGDANKDGRVNFADIASVLVVFGDLASPCRGEGDADGSGEIEFLDIATVLVNFGNTCP